MRFCFEKKDFIEQHINSSQFAIIDNQRELSWLQFESEVNSICDFFIQNNWDKLEKPVLLYGHKQAEMIVMIYALMKLKIAYIPIDVIFPNDRILSIQHVVGVEFVINCSHNSLNLQNTTEIRINGENKEIINQFPLSNSAIFDQDPLVYIIFTSGSTGEPKGVQITSEAVKTFTNWMINDFGFTHKDTFINIALFSFDLSVYEVMSFGAIGSTILLNNKITTENPDLLMDRIEKYKGSIWVSTPSFSLTYSRIGLDPKLSSIKYFLFCGETLPHPLAKTLLKEFSSSIIYNTYGPTEATVATTKVQITQEILDTYNPLPVGFPKPNSKILIENDEIIIVGDNVSIGYLNRPELNLEKFIKIDNTRAYKTGDNGFLKDGMLFFSSRTDNQIKLHGYRIELDEITSKINDIEFVLQAETIALRRNGEVKKIVCLVQLSGSLSSEVDPKSVIIEELNKSLPPYMIPSDFKFIEKMPLNQNGKADKKELEKVYLER
jgi:D-alanine--poly(phosphoribitol) ligase subunit 1